MRKRTCIRTPRSIKYPDKTALIIHGRSYLEANIHVRIRYYT